MPNQYPTLDEGESVDVFHGVEIPHPYRWMDDVDSQDVRRWVAAQNCLTDELIPDSPCARRYQDLLLRLPDPDSITLPVFRGDRRLEIRQDDSGLFLIVHDQDSSLITVGPGRHGLNPALRIHREFVYLSPTGRYVAFAGSNEASDQQNIYVWDIDSQQLVGSPIPPVTNPVVAWLPDESGFYYNVGTLDHSSRRGVCLRLLAESADSDPLVFDFSRGQGHAALPMVTGGFLIIKTINFVTQISGLHVAPLEEDTRFRTVVEDGSVYVNVVGMNGPVLYLETSWDAPRLQIIAVDLAGSDLNQRRTVVCELDQPIARTTHSVQSTKCCLAGGHLLVTYLHHACSRVELFQLDGKWLKTLPIPGFSTIEEIRRSEDGAGIELSLRSYTTPQSRLVYDIASARISTAEQLEVPWESDSVEVSQDFCRSADGTTIPMFIIRPRNGPPVQPVMLYGYGGWGQPLLPGFSPEIAAWTSVGGTYVVANLRGGGEYGGHWHDMGKGLQKQNVFDDFCAVAEHLIAKGIATPDKLAAKGLSNGALLVAACANRRPELFAAVVMEVPFVDVLNMLDHPVGIHLTAELGDPTADLESFNCILGYSPFQNVQASHQRPAIYAAVATRDERAPPSAAYQYIARLQASSEPDQMVLLRTVEDQGHTGWPWTATAGVLTEEFSFLRSQLDLDEVS